mmetsp:Transcript_15901/g.38077  ORF Transcript_15901/g.38077 Transcript_15901/m.38077 type:complete len:263 (+) Transcript_15901:297-1085(+)
MAAHSYHRRRGGRRELALDDLLARVKLAARRRLPVTALPQESALGCGGAPLLLSELTRVPTRQLHAKCRTGIPGYALRSTSECLEVGEHFQHVLVLVQRDRLELFMTRHAEVVARLQVVGDVLHLLEGHLGRRRLRAHPRFDRVDELAEHHAALELLLQGHLAKPFVRHRLNPSARRRLDVQVVLGRGLLRQLFVEAVEHLAAVHLRRALLIAHEGGVSTRMSVLLGAYAACAHRMDNVGRGWDRGRFGWSRWCRWRRRRRR